MDEIEPDESTLSIRDAHLQHRPADTSSIGHELDEVRAFLALSTVRGVGQKTLFALAEKGRSFREAVDNGPDETIPRAPGDDKLVNDRRWSAMRLQAIAQGDRLAERLEALGVALLFRHSPGFPPCLLELERPPHWLFVQGSINRLSEPSIAIVGTRKPSTDGHFLVHYIGACLAEWGAPTVSGLAAGIDQLAHEHSLRAGVPTIAVLGTGVLEDYPKGSGRMRDHILATGGTIVSEYLPTTSYSANNFVQRNRLQAALGRILIPAEWQRRSGTAHTVRFATALRRPIACLRLPDWPSNRVAFEPGLGLPGGEIFTVPREQLRFDRFVRAAIGMRLPAQPGQLSLFEDH
ncbi:DNA-processing protein DprA [Candidatus Oleimmundimicrobium sp.]|uniref:DNA-processing protein DprA n=1 Tax=Candidatus Oleimmundimicrobium sp. TaxID=3060597 RepID=UPI00272664E5|nr:DNA-processing protein DprA [Candidatus Oleimmundimicrobium sp.]MDO8885774.1 DNA-processing protein DprA [Candidatus Oleimmundimicrobium sp.]